MKKILSLVLAVVMVLGMMPAVFAADGLLTLTAGDATEYAEAINFLAQSGINIYQGTGNGAAANEGVTRWQMAIFVARFITGETNKSYWATTENKSGFEDVTDFEGYSEETLGAISFAAQNGIVNGVSATRFNPTAGVKYQEAITMIVRSLGITYKASGYPWSYINTARELGILEGINGVAWTDEINRGVVAQLLYNALFADVDGVTVVNKVFGINRGVVLITATNQVVYEGDGATVLRPDYVQFSEVNAQGEPTGVKYHIDMAKFGFANLTEANLAVGTPYFVYYKNSFADIISAQSLSKTVWNGNNFVKDKNKVDFGDHVVLTIVDKYTTLNSSQGTLTGANEVKIYQSFGATTTSVNAEYIVAWNGDIYHVSDPETPVAVYSAITGKYYRILGSDLIGLKQYELIPDEVIAEMLASSSESGVGFKQLTADDFTKFYSYERVILSDINMDGQTDRAIIRPFGFGQFFKTDVVENKKTVTKINVKYINTTEPTNGVKDNVGADGVITADNSEWGFELWEDVKDADDNVIGKRRTDGNAAEYRWTGKQLSEIPNGAYVIYYFDKDTKEIEVLKVVASSEAQDPSFYQISGYLRGFDASKGSNTITLQIGSELEEFTLGNVGNGMLHFPIKYAEKPSHAELNRQFLYPLLNQYVTLTVVDEGVLKIDLASTEPDYVILDSFVSFEKDGIVANAWSSVTDSYQQIKISQLNGWTIGGLDYNLYYFGTIINNPALGGQYIPVQLNTLYGVVSAKDGVYNIAPVAINDNGFNQKIAVNPYGFIVGTDGKGNVNETSYCAVTATDFWMIYDISNPEAKKVYGYNGKLNSLSLQNVWIVKCTNTDYIIVYDSTKGSSGIESITATVESGVKYMVFTAANNSYWNSQLLMGANTFMYGCFMTNFVTDQVEFVYLNPSISVPGFNGQYVDSLEDGAIYKVTTDANGVTYLNSLTTYKPVDVADHYAGSTGYAKTYTTEFGARPTYSKMGPLKDAVAKWLCHEYYNGTMDNTDKWLTFKANLQIRYISGGELKNPTLDKTSIPSSHTESYVLPTADGTGALIILSEP